MEVYNFKSDSNNMTAGAEQEINLNLETNSSALIESFTDCQQYWQQRGPKVHLDFSTKKCRTSSKGPEITPAL